MISKVIANSVWLVAGKEPAKESKHVAKAWLRSIHPPYYAGHGFGLRLGQYVLRMGVCTPLYNDVDLSSELDVAVYVIMGSQPETKPQEIGEWGCSDDESQPAETQPLTSATPESELPASPTTTS